MRKILTVIFAILLATTNYALAEGDLWDNYGDQNVYGQKPVSDEEFEKALESKKGKQKRDKNIPKGKNIQQSNETEMLNKMSEDLPTLLVPLTLVVDANQTIPIGYYQVIGEKENGKPHLKFYQAHYLIADVPAIETNDDFNQNTISFVKLIQTSPKQVKILFGSLDFNAFAVVGTADEN